MRPSAFWAAKSCAGRLLNAAHGGFFAGEDTEIVLLAQALEELLNLLGRNFGVWADDEQDAALAHAVGDVFQLRQRQDIVVAGLARRLEHAPSSDGGSGHPPDFPGHRARGFGGAW